MEFVLNEQQRKDISLDDLAMHILRLLQRNYKAKTQGGGAYISYSHFQMSSILEIEILNRSSTFSHGEPSFTHKFSEAVLMLQNAGYIMNDPDQHQSTDFKSITSKGLAVDTTATAWGITSPEEFLRKTEVKSGPLDAVAKAYLRESYAAAEAKLWLAAFSCSGQLVNDSST
jgi:hypothetical protein